MLRNFSAFVVKVVHQITRWEQLEDDEEVAGKQRVGDSVNSLHNKLALLYSGNDS